MNESSDQLISILLEKPLSLYELIVCRCQVSHRQLAQKIEERLLTHPFSDIPEIGDLIRIRTDKYLSKINCIVLAASRGAGEQREQGRKDNYKYT